MIKVGTPLGAALITEGLRRVLPTRQKCSAAPVSYLLSFLSTKKPPCVRAQRRTVVQDYFSASFAWSVSAVNAAGSAMAISESIFLFRVTPAFLRPFMNVE